MKIKTLSKIGTAFMSVIFATTIAAQAGNIIWMPHYYQGDPLWSTTRLGTCSNKTIGSHGCAITCVSMAIVSKCFVANPKQLNSYLTANNGYQNGCDLFWSRAADYDGAVVWGLTWVPDIGTLPSSPSSLKAAIDRGERIVVKSVRSSQHWCIIVGYNGFGSRLSDFLYFDPADAKTIYRTVGDGWVNPGAETRRYQ